MLDSETQQMKRPSGTLQGQRILVLGACCGFGRGMARALAASGAQVVVADSNADALAQISNAVPLPLKGEADVALRRVGRAWGEARLDGVLNLMPLRQPDKIDLNVAVLQGIVQGFMPALTLREGQIVSVVARPEQALDVGAGAMAPALASAQSALAHALRRDGLTLNMVSVGEGAVKPARTAVIGLLSGALGSLTGAELRL
ncbi:SDR family NAD(P)-dependent oxidoreductase [uncultured Sulfitobacter sp.]|uniref:SDR family NAD(P)-dependent oxidoreductase n=1 Tax=uncultured Sulfitobacter sp. TaxID=191468 RepID=UPI0026329965|nr:SDR family NAD(P)-dependent oxidoreductase [uncultured Sulfitobacter sp.]